MGSQAPSDTRQPESSPSLDLTHWGKYFESGDPPRLGMESGRRIPLTTITAFVAGAAIGASHGKKTAGYRFRAENAHRFPTTSNGWFQYHKSKSYTTIVGAVKEGAKMGFKLGGGALAFCLFEETVDYARNDRRDFLSSVMAGLSFSGIYSLLGLWTNALSDACGVMLTNALFHSPTRYLHRCSNCEVWSPNESHVRPGAGRY